MRQVRRYLTEHFTPTDTGGGRYPVPHGFTEIMELYGDPDKNDDLNVDPEWYEANVITVELPFYLVRSWDRRKREVWEIDAHRKAASDLVLAFRTFLDEVGAEEIHENGWDVTAGLGNLRGQRGDPNFLSAHSWWAAIDMCPELGPFGYGENFAPRLPDQLVDAFISLGWDWGGLWPQRNPMWPYDGMHFQRMTGW